MFDRMLLALLLLVVPSTLFATPQFQTEARTYTVRGTVVNSVTGEGVGGALVQIYGARQRSMLTGADGKFQFEGLSNGGFPLTVRKPGYFSTEEIRRQSAQPVYVRPEEERPVTLKLIPEGVLYGRITGDNGEPVEYMPVQIIFERVENGKRTRDNSRTVRTDEQGEFRQAELLPGKYFVFVGPSSWPVAFPARLSQSGARGYPGVYYPGVPDLFSATAIDMTAGKQAEINLSVSSQPFYRISGTLSGYGPGQGVNFQIVSASGQSIGAGVEFDEARGTFRSSWVPAGVCTITVESQDANTGRQSYGSQRLNVTSDMGGVHLALLPSAVIPVNIRLEATAPEPVVGPGEIFPSGRGHQMRAVQNSPARVVLTPQQHLFAQQQQYSNSVTDEDSAPAIRNVPPGVYSVEINPSGPYYVLSARSGSANLLQQSLTVAPGGSNQPIDVVLRDDFASLEGSLSGRESQVTTVIIMAANSIAKTMQTRNVTVMGTGVSSSFQIPQVAPGEYKILAVEGADEIEYDNPEVMSKYLSKARDISLLPNQKAKVELTVVHAGD